VRRARSANSSCERKAIWQRSCSSFSFDWRETRAWEPVRSNPPTSAGPRLAEHSIAIWISAAPRRPL
jgi:hypothetical protein